MLVRVFVKLLVTGNLALFLAIFFVACGAAATATPPPTATTAPTNTPPPTPTTAPTNTPVPTPTPRPTNTPTPTNTPPPPTATPAPTAVPAPTARPAPSSPSGTTPPHVFVGTVTVGGQQAADDTVILAQVDGQQAGVAYVKGGKFTLYVGQPEGVAYGGKTVTFIVELTTVAQTAAWELGGATVLNLVAP